MLYMVIETFRNADPKPIYERLAAKGRMMPDDLHYVSSWIADDFTTCWQVMETDRPESLEEWIASWDDLMEFEIVPVLTSAQAREKTLG